MKESEMLNEQLLPLWFIPLWFIFGAVLFYKVLRYFFVQRLRGPFLCRQGIHFPETYTNGTPNHRVCLSCGLLEVGNDLPTGMTWYDVCYVDDPKALADAWLRRKREEKEVEHHKKEKFSGDVRPWQKCLSNRHCQETPMEKEQ